MTDLLKIVLGTVQFGLDYGVTNAKGKVDFAEVVRILDLAHSNGISVLDSASSYGDSEVVLGRAFRELKKDFSVITKVYLQGEGDIHSQVFRAIEKSMYDLSGAKIYGVMAHHGNQLLSNSEQFVSALVKAKSEFKLPRIGASVYDLEELKSISRLMPLELTQIPYNVLNQSFTEGDDLSSVKNKGCEVHARSIFLQGLLLSKKQNIKPYFQTFEKHLNDYFSTLETSKLSGLEFNLGHALKEKNIDRLVLGVTSRTELLEIIDAVKNVGKVEIPKAGHLASLNENLINPAKWKV